MSADECPFRPGQLVRADFEDGTSVTGLVTDGYRGPRDGLDLACGGTPFQLRPVGPILHEATFTVVREPIPEEPTGRDALFRDERGVLWWRAGWPSRDAWVLVGDLTVERSWPQISAAGGRVVFAGEQP